MAARATSLALTARQAPRGRHASMKTTKKNVAHRMRAVVDSESAGSSADSKNQSGRPTELKLRPAGVSDAVVDSQKALEALARLGGNRT